MEVRLDRGGFVVYICMMTQTSKQRARPVKRRAAASRGPARCCNVDECLEPRFFKALGDPNRVAILARLATCGRPCTVGEIAACCTVDVSVVSRHLAVLREAGILMAEKRGKEVFYRVSYENVSETLRAIADSIDACCPPVSKGTKGRRDGGTKWRARTSDEVEQEVTKGISSVAK
jgi:ArsR family transcriptional regulator